MPLAEKGVQGKGAAALVPASTLSAAGAGSALNRTRQKRIGRCIPHTD